MKLKWGSPKASTPVIHAPLFQLLLLSFLHEGLCIENIKGNNESTPVLHKNVVIIEEDFLDSTTTEYPAPITEIGFELKTRQEEEAYASLSSTTPEGVTDWSNVSSGSFSQKSHGLDASPKPFTFPPFVQVSLSPSSSLPTLAPVSMETKQEEPEIQSHSLRSNSQDQVSPPPPSIHSSFLKESSSINLTLNQKQVISELNQLWLYSKSLNDSDQDDSALKASLSSVVQLVYARVLSEPDEMLHRLQSLLAKLRERVLLPPPPPPFSVKSHEKDEILGGEGRRENKRRGEQEAENREFYEPPPGKTINEKELDQGTVASLKSANSPVKLARENESATLQGEHENAGLEKRNGEGIENLLGTIQSTGGSGLRSNFEESSELGSDFMDYMTTTMSSEEYPEKYQKSQSPGKRDKRSAEAVKFLTDGIGEIEQISMSSLENSLQYYPENSDNVGEGLLEYHIDGAFESKYQTSSISLTSGSPLKSEGDKSHSEGLKTSSWQILNSIKKSERKSSKFAASREELTKQPSLNSDSQSIKTEPYSNFHENPDSKSGQNAYPGGFSNSWKYSQNFHNSLEVTSIYPGEMPVKALKSSGLEYQDASSMLDKSSLQEHDVLSESLQLSDKSYQKNSSTDVDVESERYFSQTMKSLMLATPTPPPEKTIQKIITVGDAPSTSYLVTSDQSTIGGSQPYEKITKYPTSPFLKVPLILPYPVSGILQRPPPISGQFSEKLSPGTSSVLSQSVPNSVTELQPGAGILPGESRPTPPTYPVQELVSVDQIANAIAQLLYPTISSFQLSNTISHSHNRPEIVSQVIDHDYKHKLEPVQNISGNAIPHKSGSDQTRPTSIISPTSQPGLYPALLQSQPLPDFLPATVPPFNSFPSTTTKHSPQIQTPKPTLSTSPLIQFLLDNLEKPPGTPDSSPGSHSNFSANLTLVYKNQKPGKPPIVHHLQQPQKPEQLQLLSPFTTQSVNAPTPATVSVSTNLKTELQTESEGGAATTKPETPQNATTGVSVDLASSTVPVLQIIGELQQSNIMQAPAAFLNGTRDGFVTFVTTLGTLSFTTKMVMVLGLSVAVLSIVLGVYSMGPPIIAVGILGIMIPIGILLLLQDSNSRNKNKKIYVLNPKAKFNMDEFKDTFEIILSVVEQAYARYKEAQASPKEGPQELQQFGIRVNRNPQLSSLFT